VEAVSGRLCLRPGYFFLLDIIPQAFWLILLGFILVHHSGLLLQALFSRKVETWESMMGFGFINYGLRFPSGEQHSATQMVAWLL
jgi:hypothetical protein